MLNNANLHKIKKPAWLPTMRSLSSSFSISSSFWPSSCKTTEDGATHWLLGKSSTATMSSWTARFKCLSPCKIICLKQQTACAQVFLMATGKGYLTEFSYTWTSHNLHFFSFSHYLRTYFQFSMGVVEAERLYLLVHCSNRWRQTATCAWQEGQSAVQRVLWHWDASGHGIFNTASNANLNTAWLTEFFFYHSNFLNTVINPISNNEFPYNCLQVSKLASLNLRL